MIGHRGTVPTIHAHALILAGCLTLGLLTSCTPDEKAAVVARINGRDITGTDLVNRIRLVRGPSLLVEMIDAQLVTSASADAGIEVSDEELDLRLQRAMAEAGSERDFEATLQQRDLSRPAFLEQLRMDMLLDKLAVADMRIDEQEVLDFYREHATEFKLGERVKARMMLFGTRDDAQAVRDTLDAGGDFEGLASALSTDPGTKDKGGDMGWFERDDYAREISDVAFALKEGIVSDVTEAPDGWVIIKVEGRQPAGQRPLEEVREELLARIRSAKLPFAREGWIRQARADAAITIADSSLREATLELLIHAPAPQPVSLMPVPTLPAAMQ